MGGHGVPAESRGPSSSIERGRASREKVKSHHRMRDRLANR
jgi:hypothetical protein